MSKLTHVSDKDSRVSLAYVFDKKIPYVTLTVGWSTSTNFYVLDKLKRGEPCACPSLAHGSECMALDYSVYQYLRAQLVGSAERQLKTKVGYMDCSVAGSDFVITIHTSTKVGFARILNIMMANLAPHRMYSIYQNNIKILNGKPSREEFNWCVNTLTKSLKSINVAVVSKFNIESAQLKLLLERVNAKYKPIPTLEKTSKPASLSTSANDTMYLLIKCKNNVTSSLLASYIRDSVALNVRTSANGVIVYTKTKLPAKINKENCRKWFGKKLKKVSDIKSTVLHFSLSRGEVSPAVVKKWYDGKHTIASLSKDVEDCL